MPPRFDAYTEASQAVFAVFDDTTPLVEGISIDEAFLDVGGLRRVAGTPVDIAAKLRADVRERVGLAITVGVARTKFLAKVASGVAKPDGLLLVPPDGELAFLHPLPIERVWGVGTKTAEKLHARGVTTVGDMARIGEGPLITILGGYAGRHLHALAVNRDPRPVETGAPAPLDRIAARPRSPSPHRRRPRHRARRHRRPRDAPAAQGRAGRAHGHAALPLRRLHPGHPLAHDARRRRPRPSRSSPSPAPCWRRRCR